MPRKRQRRRVEELPVATAFRPIGSARCRTDRIVLGLDEVEALRLCDRDGLYQEEAAALLGVSRPTLARVLEEARRKVATALTLGMEIDIQEVTPVNREERTFVCARCSASWKVPFGTARPQKCPECGSAALHREGCRRRGGEAANSMGPGGCSRRARRGSCGCGSGRERRRPAQATPES